jgi:glycosyltransferase involved in cell wall biosynthesis
MSKVRLLLGITLSQMGGAQKVVQEIIRHLPEDDYEITLATKPGGDLISWIKDINCSRKSPVNIVELDSSQREINPWNDFRLFNDLRNIIHQHDIQVVHFHSSKMGIVGRAAAASLKVPWILFTVHGWGINDYQSTATQTMLGVAEQVCGRWADEIVCVCNSDLEKGRINKWIPSNKGIVIHNGMPDTSTYKRTGHFRESLGISPDSIVVGTVARLTEAKAPEFLLKVANRLFQKNNEIHVVIIGDGPLEGDCRDLVNALGIEKRVHLVGAKNNVPQLLPEFDIFTLLSRWEGFPLAIIEAMFAGLPVVATNVGGVCEALEDGITGFLVNELVEEAAVDKLNRLLESPELRVSMGANGRNKAKRLLTVEQMVSKYDNCYKKGKTTSYEMTS